MNNLILFPVLFPLLAGIMLIPAAGKERLQKIGSGLTGLVLFISSFYLAYIVYSSPAQVLILEMGNWPAPFGIVLVADMLATLMVCLSGIVGLVCLFFAFQTLHPDRGKYYFYPFYFFLLSGVNGAFLTGDLFNLFVFFEVMLLASYVLIVMGGTRYQLRESFKYVVISVFSSILFVVGIGLIYAATGTLNMADIAVKVGQLQQTGVLNAIAVLFLIVFGLKGSLFPLYFWLPKSYYGPPAAVAALFGGLLTKVGIYAVIRTFTLIFTHNPGFTHTIILALAGLTMFFGVVGAVSQFDFKRILSYHIISQVGYMVMGLGIYTPLALAGAIYYIAHHIIVKASLFLFAGATQKVTGTNDLNRMGGLLTSHPWLAWLFLLAAISLAGMPPLSGFFSKFTLILAGIQEGYYFIVFISLLVGLLTLFSMMKIFIAVFWGEPVTTPVPQGQHTITAILVTISPLVLLTVLLGLGAEPAFQYSLGIAQQILEPANYIQAVLGEIP